MQWAQGVSFSGMWCWLTSSSWPRLPGLEPRRLRKAVVNPQVNLLTRAQAMEMVLDAVIQQGRLAHGGVSQLRGNGQLLLRQAVDAAGVFNEDTVTDDLDLSFRLLLAGQPVGSHPGSRPDQEGAANPAGSNQASTNSADFNTADFNNFALNDGAAEYAAAIQGQPRRLWKIVI
jgi:hypothetical protein